MSRPLPQPNGGVPPPITRPRGATLPTHMTAPFAQPPAPQQDVFYQVQPATGTGIGQAHMRIQPVPHPNQAPVAEAAVPRKMLPLPGMKQGPPPVGLPPRAAPQTGSATTNSLDLQAPYKQPLPTPPSGQAPPIPRKPGSAPNRPAPPLPSSPAPVESSLPALPSRGSGSRIVPTPAGPPASAAPATPSATPPLPTPPQSTSPAPETTSRPLPKPKPGGRQHIAFTDPNNPLQVLPRSLPKPPEEPTPPPLPPPPLPPTPSFEEPPPLPPTPVETRDYQPHEYEQGQNANYGADPYQQQQQQQYAPVSNVDPTTGMCLTKIDFNVPPGGVLLNGVEVDLIPVIAGRIEDRRKQRLPFVVIREEDDVIEISGSDPANPQPEQQIVMMNASLVLGDNVLVIPLSGNRPSMAVSKHVFLFLWEDEFNCKRFYIISFPTPDPNNTTAVQELELLLKDFEVLLDELTGFQKAYQVIDGVSGIETKSSKQFTSAASKIENAGLATGRSIMKGATSVGRGLRRVNNFYIDHTKAGKKEVNEKNFKSTDKTKKATGTVMKGSTAVVGGITTGCHYIGSGIAKGINFTTRQYSKTDYAKKREAKKGPEKKDTSAKIGVGKASFHAIGSVLSGMKEAGVSIATDVRDTSVERTAHREGEGRAKLAHERWDVAANVGMSTFNCVHLYTLAMGKGAIDAGTRVVLNVGAAVASYDTDKRHVLFGPAWKMGFASIRKSVMEGYRTYWMVLRNFTLAWYKSPDDHWRTPVGYIRLSDIRGAKRIEKEVCHKALSLQLTLSSEFTVVSLECNDHPAWKDMQASNYLRVDLDDWIGALQCLGYINSQLVFNPALVYGPKVTGPRARGATTGSGIKSPAAAGSGQIQPPTNYTEGGYFQPDQSQRAPDNYQEPNYQHGGYDGNNYHQGYDQNQNNYPQGGYDHGSQNYYNDGAGYDGAQDNYQQSAQGYGHSSQSSYQRSPATSQQWEPHPSQPQAPAQRDVTNDYHSQPSYEQSYEQSGYQQNYELPSYQQHQYQAPPQNYDAPPAQQTPPPRPPPLQARSSQSSFTSPTPSYDSYQQSPAQSYRAPSFEAMPSYTPHAQQAYQPPPQQYQDTGFHRPAPPARPPPVQQGPTEISFTDYERLQQQGYYN